MDADYKRGLVTDAIGGEGCLDAFRLDFPDERQIVHNMNSRVSFGRTETNYG